MSGNLVEKIRVLQSLDQRHLEVLNALMADKNFKIPLLANKMGYEVSTVRNFLTDIYKACGVSEGEEDKRGWVIREYSEAYLKMGETPPEPVNIPPKIEPKEPEKISEVTPPVFDTPRINVTPPPPRRRNTGCLIAGIVLLIVVVCSVAAFLLKGLLPSSTPSTSQQSTGVHDWYEKVYLQDGVYIAGSYFAMRDCNTSGDSFSTDLIVQNDSGYDYSMAVSQSMFSLVDSNGKSYPLISATIGNAYSETIYSSHAGQIVLCWEGRRPEQTGVEYLDLTIMGLPGSYDITFRKSR